MGVHRSFHVVKYADWLYGCAASKEFQVIVPLKASSATGLLGLIRDAAPSCIQCNHGLNSGDICDSHYIKRGEEGRLGANFPHYKTIYSTTPDKC